MDRLPLNTIFDIFSKVPVKCLARSRCVSKEWCNYIDDRYLTIIHDKRVVEEPTPILYHQHISRGDRMTRSLCFHVIESIETRCSHDYVLKPKEDPYLEFIRMKPLSKSSVVRIEVRGSCNGVVCLSQDENDVVNSLVAVHPLRKECYALPPLPSRFKSMARESCGLGFDDSTNTFKMVCVFLKGVAPPNNPDLVRKKLCTMVHVFGTNAWREIAQAPSYPITDEAICIYSNGRLHWLVSRLDSQIKDGGREIIWFDVKEEEFGLINPPKEMCDQWRVGGCDNLVDLNGEVGYVSSSTMEVWVLNHKKEWVPHCRFEKQFISYGYIDVLGCWNKDGDMLIRNRGDGEYKFYVYNIKSGVLHKTNIVGPHRGYFCPTIIMHPNKLFSIHGIDTNSFPMKKTDMKKSCRDLVSCYS